MVWDTAQQVDRIAMCAEQCDTSPRLWFTCLVAIAEYLAAISMPTAGVAALVVLVTGIGILFNIRVYRRQSVEDRRTPMRSWLHPAAEYFARVRDRASSGS